MIDSWAMVALVLGYGFLCEVLGYVLGHRRARLEAAERHRLEAIEELRENVRLYCEQEGHGPACRGCQIT